MIWCIWKCPIRLKLIILGILLVILIVVQLRVLPYGIKHPAT
jgi:hypothetical protein